MIRWGSGVKHLWLGITTWFNLKHLETSRPVNPLNVLPVQNSSPSGRNSPTWVSIASYIIIMRVKMSEEICARTSNFPWQLFMTDVIITAKAKLLHTDITAEANMCLDITAYYMILHQLFINGIWCDVASPKNSVKKNSPNIWHPVSPSTVSFLLSFCTVRYCVYPLHYI